MLPLRVRMMPFCQAVLLCVVIVVLSPHALWAEEIPLRKKGGVYQLPVEINGVITLAFVLDTGAADVNIPADVALTLHRAGTIRDADFLPGKRYTLADGSTVNSERFLLRSLKIGNRRVTNVAASMGPLSSTLLLGQSFLEQLGAWGIDSQRQVLTLGTPRQRKEPSLDYIRDYLERVAELL
jgi:clan AA aspartic protease (TIGR02281 family)